MNNRLLVLIFYIAVITCGNAQDRRLELAKVLAQLEQTYGVSFSYADQHVEAIRIVPPSEKFRLEETLAYLQSVTGLLFEQISPKYIVVRNNEKIIRVCGVVISASSRDRLEGVIVGLEGNYTTTSENGYFELNKIPESAQLTLRMLGHKTITVKATTLLQEDCPTIFLPEEIVLMDEMIISNYITEGIDKSTDGSFAIKRESLGILPGLTEPDVLQTVQSLPGIRSFNENIADINVRGGTHDQNLITWDRIKMYQTGHFFGLISAFNPYLTDNITFIKNGTSAFWGDGVSSIIDIRTDDNLVAKPTGGLGFNLIHGDGFLKIPVARNATIHFSARHSLTGLPQTPTYRKYFDRAFNDTEVTNAAKRIDSVLNKDEQFSFYDVSLKYLHNFSATNKLRISMIHMKNEINYTEDVVIQNYLESRTSFLTQQSLGSGLHYSHLWNSNLRSSVQGYVSQYELASVNHDIPNNQRLTQENGVLDVGIKLDSRLNLTDTKDLYFGYQFYEVGVRNLEDINNPAFRREVKNVLRNHAAFVESGFYSRDDRTNIRAGVRVSHFPNLRETLVEPRVAISHHVFNHIFIELLGERKSQVTTQVIDLQNDFLGVEKRRWVLSNEKDIPIIKSKQVSVGIHYKPNNLLISLEGYHKIVDGIITSSQGFQNQFQFVRSTGSYSVNGLDFLINKQIGSFNGWVTYSAGKNTFRFNNLTPPVFRSNLDIRNMAGVGLSYKRNSWSASTGLNYHSGRPFTKPVSPDEIINNNIIYEAPNSSDLPHFLRFDVAVKYNFAIKKARIHTGISVWNLFNRKNVIDTYYFINDQGVIDSRARYALEATTNFVLRISF